MQSSGVTPRRARRPMRWWRGGPAGPAVEHIAVHTGADALLLLLGEEDAAGIEERHHSRRLSVGVRLLVKVALVLVAAGTMTSSKARRAASPREIRIKSEHSSARAGSRATAAARAAVAIWTAASPAVWADGRTQRVGQGGLCGSRDASGGRGAIPVGISRCSRWSWRYPGRHLEMLQVVVALSRSASRDAPSKRNPRARRISRCSK